MRPFVIGLTGPIASGKDTVARILKSCGAHVIDADRIGHQIIRPRTLAWHKIVKVFGREILRNSLFINRRKLASIVFANPASLKKLNKIAHPPMVKEIKRILKKHQAKKLVVINAAILREMRLIPLVDQVWVVMANRRQRLTRLVKGGLPRKEALLRINSQPKDKEYLRIADEVIRNDGNINRLVQRVEPLIKLSFRSHPAITCPHPILSSP